jgi:hypothetical protein
MVSPTHFSSWWGRHSIEAGRTDMWQIGPLNLWIEHLPFQWRLSWKHGDDWLDPRVRALQEATPESIPSDVESLICAYGSGAREELVFAPTLPNRALVARLSPSLHVLPGEDVNLYVVSPLWLRIEMAQPSKLLHEIPVFRLSDTWFGPMTGAGELAYASSSSAFLDLRQVPLRLHCVITAMNIRNLGSDALKLDRVSVPLPRLSLFYSPRTGFWTDTVSLERKDDRELATLRLDRQPPPDASPTQFITGPRLSSAESSNVIRAFSHLFKDRSTT